MNNPLMMIMQMMNGGGNMNPMQMMGMFGNDPRMKQVQQMLNNGGNPQEIAKNLTNGMNPQQLQQIQQMAQQFGIKL